MQSARQSILLIVLSGFVGRAQVNILTGNGNNDRTNANLQETQLSPITVTRENFGKIGAFHVDGQVYAQALYASGVVIGAAPRNVVFVATMHNSVYAFDAAVSPSETLLWRVNLGPSVPSEVLFKRYSDIEDEVGILAAGAIDLQRGVLYVVSNTLSDGTPAFHLHALDLSTGEERLNGPVAIAATVRGTGTGSRDGIISFDPGQHIQRPGLLLANGCVYAAFGSHADESPWHGWLMSYDASDLSRQAGVYMTTPSGDGGSFWQSGRGLAADSFGNLYGMTGNGDYDGLVNFSQSFLKFSGAAPVRIGSYTPPDWKAMSDSDFDLSAGPALISGTQTLIGADKTGYLYVLNGDTMGSTGTPGTPNENYFLAAPYSIFNFAVWSFPEGALVFVQGSRAPLTSYRITGTAFDPNPVAVAQTGLLFGRIGMTLSADGARLDSGIIWETSGDPRIATAQGTLRAFNASDLAELWSTDLEPERDSMGPFGKFVSPTVADGRVYVPTSGNSVVVYGLLNSVPQ